MQLIFNTEYILLRKKREGEGEEGKMATGFGIKVALGEFQLQGSNNLLIVMLLL